jgi:predicted PhzF superfamily epimerase YddE/YHI9
MEYKYMVIDAFSIRPFRGNPAAVVLTTGDLSDEIFQWPQMCWPFPDR